MSKDIAIKVENLSKIYKLYNAPIDRMKEALHPFKKNYHKEFYALNDVSFEIKKGEIVGIIGKNGCGKSTLLKIITGVLTPTSGKVMVHGRISALLELGAGFNPEYTGVENIYFQGNLMGFEHDKMESKVQDILDFADIGDFIYQPVKNYSSGMFARLAFAVAINVEPEILIIDEALSVGDAFFQTKCMEQMRYLMKQGVTVLFVSHDTHAVKSFCDSAIFLEDGNLVSYGDVSTVVGRYIQDLHLSNNDQIGKNQQKIESRVVNFKVHDVEMFNDMKSKLRFTNRYGSGTAQIIGIRFLDSENREVEEIDSCDEYCIEAYIQFYANFDSFVVVVPIRSLNGIQQLGVSSAVEKIILPAVTAGDVYLVRVKSNLPIQAGIYNATFAVEYPIELNLKHEFLDVIENCCTFKVNWGNKVFPTMFYQKGNIEFSKIELLND